MFLTSLSAQLWSVAGWGERDIASFNLGQVSQVTTMLKIIVTDVTNTN